MVEPGAPAELRSAEVFRNDALACVELEMKAAGILDFATSL